MESNALALSPTILTLPPKRISISGPKSDIVTKDGKLPGHFYSSDLSSDVFYPTEIEAVLLQFKGPESMVGKDNLDKFGPRAYFPGKFSWGAKPVCKSNDGVNPLAAYPAETQLQQLAVTCQVCSFGVWTVDEKGKNIPPPCRQKIKMIIAHLTSGLRFELDINAGIRSAYRTADMYRTLVSTLTYENSLTGDNKPEFGYSFLMEIKMEGDTPVLNYSKIRPVINWERFIPLYADLVAPKLTIPPDIESEIEGEVLESL